MAIYVIDKLRMSLDFELFTAILFDFFPRQAFNSEILSIFAPHFRQYAISIDTGTSSGCTAQCHRGGHWAEDGVAARLRLPGAGYLQ